MRILDVVLVVAGHKECSLPGDQVAQWLRSWAELFDRPIHYVAHDRHEVRRGLVDHPDDPLGVCTTRQRAEMDVRHDSDPEPGKRRIEPAQAYRYLQQVGRAERVGSTDPDE